MIYAIADEVPEECTWFVAGKKYPVLRETEYGFTTFNEFGERCYSRWSESSHLMLGDFRRVEE